MSRAEVMNMIKLFAQYVVRIIRKQKKTRPPLKERGEWCVVSWGLFGIQHK